MEVEKGISSPLILPEAWADLTDWGFGASDGKGRWAYFANWNAAEPSNFRPFSALSARRKLEICWKWNWGFPEIEKRKYFLSLTSRSRSVPNCVFSLPSVQAKPRGLRPGGEQVLLRHRRHHLLLGPRHRHGLGLRKGEEATILLPRSTNIQSN